METLDIWQKDVLALALARTLTNQRHLVTTTKVADGYLNSFMERLLSEKPGGRTDSTGTVLYFIHPEACFAVDEEMADRLLKVAHNALTHDTFIGPEKALLMLAFAAERTGSSACLDLLSDTVNAPEKIARRERFLEVSKHLQGWLNRNGSRQPLKSIFPLENLIPDIQRRTRRSEPLATPDPNSTSNIASTARNISKKARVSTWTPRELAMYDGAIRNLADNLWGWAM